MTIQVGVCTMTNHLIFHPTNIQNSNFLTKVRDKTGYNKEMCFSKAAIRIQKTQFRRHIFDFFTIEKQQKEIKSL